MKKTLFFIFIILAFIGLYAEMPQSFNLVSPRNDTTLQVTTPTYIWESAGNYASYQLIWSKHSDFTDMHVIDVGETSAQLVYYTVAPTDPENVLQDTTTYFWKVYAFDGADARYNNGSYWRFHVNTQNQAPSSFTINNPINGEILLTNTPTLIWNESIDPNGDLVYYNVQLSNYEDLHEPIAEYMDMNILSTNFSIEDTLGENLTYYWQVIATDLIDDTESENTGFFTIDTRNEYPFPFTLLSPADNTEFQTTTPFLDWEDTTDPDPSDPQDSIRFFLRYSADNWDSFNEISDLDQTEYQFPANVLNDNTQYSWKVYAVDRGGSGLWRESTDEWYFVINLQEDSPGAFNTISPAEDDTSNTLNIAFAWEESVDPDPNDQVRYRIYMSDTPDFSQSLYTYPAVGYVTGSNSYTLLNHEKPDDNNIYYWKVTAYDNNGNQTTSNVSTFIMDSEADAPGVFNLVYPVGGIINTTLPEFKWTQAIDPDPLDPPESVKYNLQVSLSTNFNNPVINDTVNGLEDQNQLISYQASTPLSNEQGFYWRVIAFDRDGNSRVCQNGVSGFTISYSNDEPEDFNLLTPANHYTTTDQTPLFTWERATDPNASQGDVVTYEFIIATNPSFVETYHHHRISGLTENEYQLQGEHSLNDNTLYYWRVIAHDLNGGSTQCNMDFILGVDQASQSPNDFQLLAPFDGYSILSYDTLLFFDWMDAIDPDPFDTVTYTLQTSIYRDFGTVSNQVDSIRLSNYTLPADSVLLFFPEDNTTYYWRVRAVDSDGYYRFSTPDTQNIITNYPIHPPDTFALMSPANLSLQTSVTFDWTDSSDPDPSDDIYYRLYWLDSDSYIGDTSGFNSIVVEDASYYTVTAGGPIELEDNGIYYWYVKCFDTSVYNNSRLCSFQSVGGPWQFGYDTQRQPPGTFELLYPENNSVVKDTTSQTIIFDWSDADPVDPYDQITYSIDIATDYAFTEIVSQTSGLTLSANPVSGLQENTGYYWRVVAEDTDEYEIYSNIANFTINRDNEAPVSVSLVSPGNNSFVSTQYPTFYWNAANDPDPGDVFTYTLYIYDNSDLLEPYAEISGIDSLSYSWGYSNPLLQDNSTYYWKIKAADSWSETVESAVYPFTIGTEVPSPFSLISPEHESTWGSQTVQFTWETSSTTGENPIYYTLYLSEELFDISTDIDSFIVATNSKTLGPAHINENTQYYWKVKAYVDNGEAVLIRNSAEEGWYFYVNSIEEPPDTFSLVSPAHHSAVTTVSPNFVWEPSIPIDPDDEVTYKIQVDTSASFSSPIVEEEGIETESYQTTANLTDNKIYFWRVQAIDSDNQRRYSSETWRFLVNLESEAPLPFALVYPLDMVTADTTITFQWEIATDPDEIDIILYDLEISRDTLFQNTVTYRDIIYNTKEVTFTERDSFPYYWRVTAKDATGLTSRSNIGVFRFDFEGPGLSLYFMKNPIAPVYIDIIIVANEALSSTPSGTLYFPTGSSGANMIINQAAESDYIYRSQFINTAGQSGDGSVIINAADQRGNLTTIEQSFNLSLPGSRSSIICGNGYEIALPDDFFNNNQFIFSTLVENDNSLTGLQSSGYEIDLIFQSDCPAGINISCDFTDRENLAVIHLDNPNATAISYSLDNENILFNVYSDGRYGFFYDFYSPQLMDPDYSDGIISCKASDIGSGINLSSSYILLDGKHYYFNSDNYDYELLTFDISSLDASSGDILIKLFDYAGNETVIEFKIQLHSVFIKSNKLMQNTPNPFNPVTTISFDLKERCHANLSIYNIKGELINTLCDQYLDYGSHSIVWKGQDKNGNQTSSGIYFYKLALSNGESFIDKMILLK